MTWISTPRIQLLQVNPSLEINTFSWEQQYKKDFIALKKKSNLKSKKVQQTTNINPDRTMALEMGTFELKNFKWEFLLLDFWLSLKYPCNTRAAQAGHLLSQFGDSVKLLKPLGYA